MNKFSIIFGAVFLLLTSCGGVKKNIVPRYVFELGKTLHYQLNTKINLSLDGGFFQYSGDVTVSAGINMTPIFSNENGTKIMVEIKDPDVKTANPQIRAAIYMGLNAIRNWFADFYMNERGETTVFMQGKPILGLRSYVEAVFPDFTDVDGMFQGISETTNFPARYQDQDLTMVYKRNLGMKDTDAEMIRLGSKTEFLTYYKEDLLKSADPSPMGVVSLDIDDWFNYLKGRLEKKNGKLQVSFSVAMKESLISYILSFQGNGDFQLILLPELDTKLQ
jgi:hypothetical protein